MKKIPKNAIKCQDEPDTITGHIPCWVPICKIKRSDFGFEWGNKK